MDVKLMKSLCLLVFLSCGSLYGSSFGRRHHHHSSSNNDQLNKNAVSEYLLNDLQRDSRATTTTAANDDVPKSCPTSTILNVKKHRIIKTNESTKNGASFLDRPPHVESQDQCIAACCKTDQCNLAVFEADGEHSCYLFDCQKPSVCKFVDHDSYSTIDVEYRMIPPATPAAESKPRPPTKKPTSTKPTISDKHEDDLKMIGEKNANDERVEDEENDNDSNDDGDKKPMIDDDGDNKDAIDLPEKTAEVVSTTVMPVVATTTIRKAKSKKRPTLAAPVEEQKFVRPSCGRFQFECLNKNTEIGPTCIAQYDQCDGVEQCLDGSDEEGCDTSDVQDTDVKGRKKVNSDTSSTPHLKVSHGKTRKKPDSKTDVDEDKDTKTDTETIPEKVHLAQKAGKKINSIDVETKLKDTSSESQQRISEESGGSTNAKANEHRDTPRPDKPSTAEIDNSNKPSTKLLKQPPNTDKDMTAVVKEKLSSQDTNEKDSREKDNEPESEVAVNTDAPPVANTIKSGSPIKPEVALDDVQGINELSADNIHSQSHSPFDMGSRTAVIALSLGLAIMALLLLIVGCRLRTVKRRLRRGRPLNSNEADYLINGMYL